MIFFTLSACIPGIKVPIIDVVRSCLLKVVAEGATRDVFAGCINTGGLVLTESILEALERELLNFTEEALTKVTDTLLDPASPAADISLADPVDKKAVVGFLVKEIKTISEED